MLVLLYGHERVTGARTRLSDTDISRRNEPVDKKKSQLRRGRYLGISPHTYCMSLRVSQPAEGAGYLCNVRSDTYKLLLFDVIPLVCQGGKNIMRKRNTSFVTESSLKTVTHRLLHHA